jgi:hypothetical protein
MHPTPGPHDRPARHRHRRPGRHAGLARGPHRSSSCSSSTVRSTSPATVRRSRPSEPDLARTRRTPSRPAHPSRASSQPDPTPRVLETRVRVRVGRRTDRDRITHPHPFGPPTYATHRPPAFAHIHTATSTQTVRWSRFTRATDRPPAFARIRSASGGRVPRRHFGCQFGCQTRVPTRETPGSARGDGAEIEIPEATRTVGSPRCAAKRVFGESETRPRNMWSRSDVADS